ncbi:MAG: head decoration protein [Roseinatronobacter sp.]
MTVLRKPPNTGDLLKYEVNPNFTRDTVTLLAGTAYPVGAVLGRVTASGKYKLATSGGSDGAQTASAVLLYAVDASETDGIGIVLARGPAIVARGLLSFDATVDDGAKITTKHNQLASLGIVARDNA